MRLAQPAAFFAHVRTNLFGGSLPQRAVDRLSALLDAFDQYGDGDIRKAAYCCATAQHESGAFKWDKEIWGPTAAQRGYEGRADLGNTQPGDGKRFMGRGFLVMITGRANYTDWSRRLGVDLVGNPELATDVPTAALIGVQGMMLGTFTKKKLADYTSYTDMRRVVNGTDKAALIAGYAETYEAALRAGRWGVATAQPATPPTDKPNLAAALVALLAQIISAFTKRRPHNVATHR